MKKRHFTKLFTIVLIALSVSVMQFVDILPVTASITAFAEGEMIESGTDQENRTEAIVEINEKNFPHWAFRNYVRDLTDFNGNKIGSDDILTADEIAAVKEIDISSMPISNIKGIEYFTSLEKLNCNKITLWEVDLSQNKALKTFYCSYTNLKKLDLSNNTNLTELDCSSNHVTELDLSNNPKLMFLNCSSNQLTALDLSNNTKLADLLCDYNQLTTLDVSRNTELKILNCYKNQLTTLDMSENTKLEELQCYENQLTMLDVSGNTELKTLTCYKNQLTTLDLSNNTKLTDLWCNYNQLTTLDVSRNTELEELHCYKNQLTTLDMSRNTKLTKLECSFNQLKELDVSNNARLKILECYENQLTELDVSNTELTRMYCDNNSLASIETGNLEIPAPSVLYPIEAGDASEYILPECVNLERVTNIQGGTIDFVTRIVTPDIGSDKVTYDYKYNDAGNTINFVIGFGLVINNVNFPDWEFRNYVQNDVKDINGKRVGEDKILTTDEITAVKELKCIVR